MIDIDKLIKIAANSALDSYFPNNFPKENHFKNHLGIEGFFKVTSKHVFLTFAGSNDLLDLIPHFEALIASFHNSNRGAYHYAYNSIKDQLWQKVFNKMYEADFKTKKLVIIGHSYGSAIAARAAFDAAKHNLKSTVITFAEPSYFGKAEWEDFDPQVAKNIEYYWVANRFDLIKYIPFRLRHYPQAHKIHFSWLWNFHGMERYISVLQKRLHLKLDQLDQKQNLNLALK